jgi:NADH-quinone oxidoreductase subunit N
MARPQLESEEASLKYFLAGSFASGLFSSVWLFSSARPVLPILAKILARVSAGQAQPVFLIVGAALLLIGLGFKIAVGAFPPVGPRTCTRGPFHGHRFHGDRGQGSGFWLPDWLRSS